MRKTLKEKNNLISLIGAGIFILISILVYFSVSPELISPKKTITIGVFTDSFWDVQNGNTYKVLNNAIDKFKKANPNVEVKYDSGILKDDYSEWLSSKILAGDGPDLFFVLPNDLSRLIEVNALYPLNSYINKEDNDLVSEFYSSSIKDSQKDFKQYALPYECAPRLMFVNQSILDSEGISIPEGNWTWDQFIDICKKVTKDTNSDNIIDQFGEVNYTWEDAFNSNNVELFSNDGYNCYLQGDKVSDSIKFIEQLNSLNDELNEQDFKNGNVAFEPMLFSEFRAYKSYPLNVKKYNDFKWSCIPMPSGPSGENISSLTCLQLGINNKSKNKDEAWEFMKVLTTDKEIQSQVLLYSEGISPIKEVTENSNSLNNLNDEASFSREELSQAVENAATQPHFENYSLAKNQVDKSINTILTGNSAIDTELVIQNREINNILKNDLFNNSY